MNKAIIPLMLSAVLAYSQEVTLNLSEKYSVNQTYHVDASGNSEELLLIKSGDNVIKDESESFKFTGSADVTVLEIDNKGRPIKSKFKVVKITKSLGEEKISILNPGDEVLVSRDNKFKLKYELAGMSVSKNDQKVLEMIVSVRNTNLPSDDETFGPGKPVQVGEEWLVNKENCIKGLSEIGVINPRDVIVDGKFKLNSVAKVGGDECAFISGFMTLNKAGLPLPPGLIIDKSIIGLKATGVFPIGTTKNRTEETEEFKLDLSAAGAIQRQDQEMPMSIVMKATRKVSRKYK